MRCPKCYTEITDGSKFCTYCGNKIEELQEQETKVAENIQQPDTENYNDNFDDTVSAYGTDLSTTQKAYNGYDNYQNSEPTVPAENNYNSRAYNQNNYYTTNPVENTGMNVPVKKKSNANLAIIISVCVAVVALAVAGVFVYMTFFSDNDGTQNTDTYASENIDDEIIPEQNATEPEQVTSEQMSLAKKVTVPDMTGKTKADCKKQIQELGLNYIFTDMESDEIPGTVIEQSMSNVEVDKGTTIYFYISVKEKDNTSTTISNQDGSQTRVSGFTYDMFINGEIPKSRLSSLSSSEIQSLLNEIYARNGYIFKDSSLRAYYEKQPCYNGIYNDMNDAMADFTYYERVNQKNLTEIRDNK